MPQSPAGSATSGPFTGSDPSREEHGGDDTGAGKWAGDPLIGKVVSGRFRIVSVIARGGMGKVYKAEQAPLGRVCALKVLSPKYEGDKDPEFHRRFFLEAATAAKLTHPNTVTIFDYGIDGDIYYIAMEFIEGRTMFRALRDEGPFSEARTAHIARQICRALREAHGLGVIHRDLKPGNVLLSSHGDEKDYVKVLDFGLVKDVTGDKEDLTQQGLFMGSPKYMAPEQILGGEVSARTDVYALGVMMYEMLCGRVPFDRGAGVGTLMAHVHNPPPSLQSFMPGILLSPTMESIVFRCLEKDPNSRFASMNDLLIALKHTTGEDSLVEGQDSLNSSLLPHPSRSSLRITGAGQMSQTDLTPYPPRGSSSGPMTVRSAYPGMPPSPPSGDFSPGPAPVPDSSMIAAHVPVMQPKRRVLPWVIAGGAALVAVIVVVTSRVPGTSNGAVDSPGTSPTGTSVAGPATAPTAAIVAPPTPTAVERKVRVESTPPGASVVENGKQVCSATPCELTWKGDDAKAEHKLSLSKGGHKPATLTVKPADEKVAATLDKAQTAAPKVVPSGYKDAY